MVEAEGRTWQLVRIPVKFFSKEVLGGFREAGGFCTTGFRTDFRTGFVQRSWGSSRPFRVIQSHWALQLFPGPSLEGEEDRANSSSGSLDSSAVFMNLPGGILRVR